MRGYSESAPGVKYSERQGGPSNPNAEAATLSSTCGISGYPLALQADAGVRGGIVRRSTARPRSNALRGSRWPRSSGFATPRRTANAIPAISRRPNRSASASATLSDSKPAGRRCSQLPTGSPAVIRNVTYRLPAASPTGGLCGPREAADALREGSARTRTGFGFGELSAHSLHPTQMRKWRESTALK